MRQIVDVSNGILARVQRLNGRTRIQRCETLNVISSDIENDQMRKCLETFPERRTVSWRGVNERLTIDGINGVVRQVKFLQGFQSAEKTNIDQAILCHGELNERMLWKASIGVGSYFDELRENVEMFEFTDLVRVE